MDASDSFEDRVIKMLLMSDEMRETIAEAAIEILDAIEECEFRIENQTHH